MRQKRLGVPPYSSFVVTRRCDEWTDLRMNMSTDPAAEAHALVERLFALLHDCRAIVRQLEPSRGPQQSASAEAERLLYFGLIAAIEDGLVRTAEDVLAVLRQASRPLGPMGEKWLREQERNITEDRN